MKKLVYIIIGIFFIAGCDDDDKDNWTRYEYLGEAKDYCYFKVGTQWVYKKIPGGELDTIDVYYSKIDTLELVDGGKKMYYEEIEWMAKSRLDAYEYHFYRPVPSPWLGIIDKESIVFRPYGIDRSKPGSPMGPTVVFFSPMSSEYTGGLGNHTTTLLSQIENIEIQGGSYQNVQHFDIDHDATFIWDHLGRRGGHVQYYWAPHVGIIKKEHMTKNIAWELVSSHIVQ